jgi:hypothetical protein
MKKCPLCGFVLGKLMKVCVCGWEPKIQSSEQRVKTDE